MQELVKYGWDLEDIRQILIQGYDAPRKRKRECIERWLDKGKKTHNAVIVKTFNEQLKEDVWLIIQVGKFTKRKK